MTLFFIIILNLGEKQTKKPIAPRCVRCLSWCWIQAHVDHQPNLTVVSFPDWTGLDEDEDAHVWEDNWDDDNVEDDFSNQLR